MVTLQEEIKKLRHAYLQNERSSATLWGLLQEHELLHAYAYLLAKRERLPFPPLNIEQAESGCVLLIRSHFFPWAGLPYPQEHAELGWLLLQTGEEPFYKIACNMAAFQYATLDHDKRPLFAIYRQEAVGKYGELCEANRTFFAALPADIKKGPSFFDAELGIVSLRRDEETFFSSASGCKSGIGALLFRDVGILNFAPQRLPLGESENFLI
jgi:hypothetical protein